MPKNMKDFHHYPELVKIQQAKLARLREIGTTEIHGEPIDFSKLDN